MTVDGKTLYYRLSYENNREWIRRYADRRYTQRANGDADYYDVTGLP